MKKNHLLRKLQILAFFSTIIFIFACSKSASPAALSDPCAGITITISSTTTDADAGSSNGNITAAATGSTGLVFSINNGTFQTSGTFGNLAAGVYKIAAKNTNNCSSVITVAVKTKNACSGTAGPKFTAVRTMMLTNCAISGCHNGTQAPDYTIDCNIVGYADLIKTRAVDNANTADQMPQPPRTALVQADRDKITAWISAGKRLTD